MFRRPGHGGRSKASADTLCQNYECTVSAQERPYKSRPSRTQQLLNPKLKPKLTSDVPSDLLRKKGVADEILAKKQEERGRKLSRDHSRKRTRSISSYSSDSVSTISTHRSASRSPPPKRIENGSPPLRGEDALGKRSRRFMDSGSDNSPERLERNTRRRLSSFSPAERGRRRTRSRSSRMDMSNDDNSRLVRASRYRSRSRTRERHERQTRRPSPPRSSSRSSHHMDISEHANGDGPRGTWGASPPRRRRPRSRSQSRSPFRSLSPNPHSRRRAPRSPRGARHRFDDAPVAQNSRNGPPPAQLAPQKERSLSPYSKRVAMTRQLQGGR